MRYLIIIISLGLLIQPTEYPPELPPIISPHVILRAMGLYAIPDEFIEHIEGDVVTADIMVVLASGTNPAHCQMGIDRINITAVNSGVATAQVRLVSCFPTTYASSGNVTTDLTRLLNGSDGHLDNVHAERDLVGADTVVLLSFSSNACGVAYLGSAPFTAFAVVNDTCIPNSSFEHEWGHNVGMSHDLPNAASAILPYSYGWCFGNGFKDVLTYPSPCTGNRAAFYSNPDIIYQGRPTGTATANNARVLRERIAYIAGFRVRPEITNHLR